MSEGSYDVYLLKITSNGGLIWEKTTGGFNADNAYSIIKTSDNNFLVVGSTESYGSGGKDVYLIKFNSVGDTIWTKTFGGAGDDWASSIKETADGGFIISGYTNSYGINYDIYIIKTDANGYSSFETIIPITERLKIYPNPSSGLFVIEIPETIKKGVVVKIINIQGKGIYEKLLTYNSTNKIEIDIRNNPKGIYIVCVKGNYYYRASKIIIN